MAVMMRVPHFPRSINQCCLLDDIPEAEGKGDVQLDGKFEEKS
jgi:hypothetical protein